MLREKIILAQKNEDIRLTAKYVTLSPEHPSASLEAMKGIYSGKGGELKKVAPDSMIGVP